MDPRDHAKELAAQKALEYIHDDMVLGLGTGSTASHFIRLLGERVQKGLKVRGIPTSKGSEELAKSLSIPVIDFHQTSTIDLAVDGADEIAPGLALIKGGGGALLREKIVASASKKFIVVADSSKIVKHLGKFPLPVEVITMAAPLVAAKLTALGIRPQVRQAKSGGDYVTDEGNLILDCNCGEIQDPPALAAAIRAIVGVVEHGLFLNMADLAIVSSDQEISLLSK
ncbi:MAG TPA: ribose-5-phosphate isomerase RpiA [Candidatus Acidoferrum sp.]|nr:ribose-5-phosphate isomerase RpiA [Candidatus Acidoferrum sp.]